jgi:transposase
MYVRQKKNKSGVISVQVIDKSSGSYKVVQTIGSSKEGAEVEGLLSQGKAWIAKRQGQLGLDFSNERLEAERFLGNIIQISVRGVDLLLTGLFEEIGFGAIKDSLFKRLVFSRLSHPSSKLRTTEVWSKYAYLEVEVQSVYRYMDKLHKSQKELLQSISYEHTLKVLKGSIQMVFYDVTTLYFEIEQEDDLRKTGFSKEGKHQSPQILLGLLVSNHGYPLAYEIFEGNKFEGDTMLPIIEAFKGKYKVDKLVVIADSGLLSKHNMDLLVQNTCEFILGARLKSEPDSIKEQVLALDLVNGSSARIKKSEQLDLIVSFSENRAKKDKANRLRGLQKLEKLIKSGKLTKNHINNRGYNKYLKMDGRIDIAIDYQKFDSDAQWDGLKAYLTNTDLSTQEVIDNYGQLWHIEKAFRVSKHDMKIRPIYHRIQRRIEAHICIAFCAYKLYKELERQLKVKNSALSPDKAIEIAKTIYQVTVQLDNSKDTVSKVIYNRPQQIHLAQLFGF